MKIGIITMHRVIHFGSVLQAYALQKFLLNNGLDNEIIDYVYPNKLHNKTNVKKFRYILSKTYHAIITLLSNTKKYSKSEIKKFIRYELIKSKQKYKTAEKLSANYPKYDIYLTGSDQVWNTEYLKGDTSFFCSFVNTEAPKIAYAASFGRFTFEGDKAKSWLSNLLSYKALSVREKNAQEIIKLYTGLDAELVVDPTLLLSKNDWIDFAGEQPLIKGKYIFVYILVYAWNPFPYALDTVKHFEKLTGWKVVVIEPMFNSKDYPEWQYAYNLSPHQFVNIIKNAGLVITNSFHGTTFSINLEVPFISIINRNKVKDDRIKSLCERVGCEDSLLMEQSPLPDFPHLDFSKNTVNLEKHRENSANYLLSAISANIPASD